MSGVARGTLLAVFGVGCVVAVALAGREQGSTIVAGLFVVLVFALSQERR